MLQQNFINLTKELQQIVKQIPLHWGKVQNDETDAQLNIFKIDDYATLENAIANFDHETKNYFIKRWFIYKCAVCDEHIFCLNENATPNPQKRDQTYDIEFNKNALLRFDIKGTLIPKQFRNNVEEVINKPKILINFFYEQQSKGVRNSFQNRLFIVHHSFKKQEREMMLRCHFDFKIKAFHSYATTVNTTSQFMQYENAIADIIFIIENTDGSFEWKIASTI